MDIKVRITLLDSMLGMAPANKEIYTDYVALNNPNYDQIEEEIESIREESGVTVFPRIDNKPIVYDYQVRGFIKEAIKALKDANKGTASIGKNCAKIKAHKKAVDNLIFVYPREIPFDNLPSDWAENMEYCERPLRASTPMGERIALAKSETVPAGCQLTFTIKCLDDTHKAVIEEVLDYGQYKGLGQWRNSGHGRFTYEIIS